MNRNQYKTSRLPRYEQLESRRPLSALGFIPHTVVESDAHSPATVRTADFDGDGDLDVLFADFFKIGWYENIDGLGTFGRQRPITNPMFEFKGKNVEATDVDGDGDLDVLSASPYGAAWYENRDGMGDFGPPQSFSDSWALSGYVEDLDGDGDADALLVDYGGLAWYENIGGHGFSNVRQEISDWSRGPVSAQDLDGDGDADVIKVVEHQEINWHENTDGRGTFGPDREVASGSAPYEAVMTADVDRDGDADILAAYGGGRIVWYENTDGKGRFGGQQLITDTGYASNRALSIGDLDGDGDLDVLSASAWHANTDGQGTFGPPQVITTAPATSVHVADLDGDGNLDVLAAIRHEDRIVWHRNVGSGLFLQQVPLSTTSPAQGVQSVHVADLDGDGDIDLLSASQGDDKIAWYENTDGRGAYGPQQVITTAAQGASSVRAADLDGDGDLDVLSASQGDDKIAWHENTDGRGAYGPQQVITTAADGANSVRAADLDGDGDVDLLSASSRDHKIAWYENTNGKGMFGPQRVVTVDATGASAVGAADLDGDGDIDLLSASSRDDKIAWYENIDGSGMFGPQRLIALDARAASDVRAEDLDGDGDLDVIAASGQSLGYDIAWYENTDGSGSFGAAIIVQEKDQRVTSVSTADLDGDGDADILAASFFGTVAWYENVDGQAQSWSQQVISKDNIFARSVYGADVDNDGDVDVFAASSSDDKLAWYENRLIGDADDDGEVSFADFLTLAAHFGDVNTSWEDGDFDQNGKVEFSDFLALAANFGAKREFA